MSEFDFIVVGAGSAGCPLASRLSEDPNVSVLQIEAGGSRTLQNTLNTCIPAAAGKLQHQVDCDWEFYAEVQPGRACTGLIDGKSYWPRGKGLGGSSALNYLAYVRGNNADFDHWENEYGACGWNYANVLPFFKKSEDSSACFGVIDRDYHGVGGPLCVSTKHPVQPLAQAFVNAAIKAGHVEVDYNGASQIGTGLHQHTVRNGMRCSTADAFIFPLQGKRHNLTIITGVLVRRVILECKRAVGVEVESVERPQIMRAIREVILCAGAIGSPHLLQLSGIGPREVLAKANIKCIAELPVGRNMQDHLVAFLRYSPLLGQGKQDIGAVNAVKAESLLTALPNLLCMLFLGRGILTTSAYDASIFIRSSLQSNDRAFPDIQVSMFAAAGDKALFERNINILASSFLSDSELQPDAEGMVLCCTLLHPRSYGSIEATSDNPHLAPRIEAGYLSETSGIDMKTIIEAIKQAVKVVTQHPLASLVAPLPILPPALLTKHGLTSKTAADPDNITDAFWEDYVRSYATTLYHPTGTCRISSVVDAQCKVYGLEALRVADASIQPEIVSGNTNASCVMIGERVAHFIQVEHGLITNPKSLNLEATKARKRRAQIAFFIVFSAVVACTAAIDILFVMSGPAL